MTVSSRTHKAPQKLSPLQNPIILLLVAGTLIGLNLPLGKISGTAGISPLIWAFTLSLGAATALFGILLAQGKLQGPTLRTGRYMVISGLVSFVLPNLLMFTAIPIVGAGFMGLMFALSPLFTVALSTLAKLKTPSRLGLAGIFIGLVGAIIISIARSNGIDAPSPFWIAASVLVPVLLACGNVYRTIDWPDGASPDLLAFGSHLFAVGIYLAIMAVGENANPFVELQKAPTAALAQMIVAGFTFPVFFRLQQVAGPVLLSQVGYVAAGVSLIFATALLGESYSLVTWVGACITGIAILITIKDQLLSLRP